MDDLTNRHKFILFAVTLFIIGVIVVYVNEFQWLQNTVEAKKLILFSIGIGVVFGLLLGCFFAKKRKDLVDKMRIYSFFIITGIILMPLVGSLMNRLLSFQAYKNKEVELFDQKGFIADIGIINNDEIVPDGYFSFIIMDNKLVRLKSKNKLFFNAQKGDKVFVESKIGIWGFEVIRVE